MVLLDHADKKWEYSEHTRVKHEILTKYMVGWVNILGTYHNLNIFDCFAGRGIYTDNSEGSPLKIIKILVKLKNNRNRPTSANLFIIERDKRNYKKLIQEIENLKQSEGPWSWLTINTYNDEFANVIKEIITSNSVSPAFFFIDPFGFKGIPISTIKKLLSNTKTEVFITFMVRDVNRFLASPPHQNSIKELFGLQNIEKKLIEEPYSQLKKEQAILKLYRNQLYDIANVKFTFPFKVNADNKLQTTYYLIHCTNHPKGCELMKAIMYNSGTRGRFGYFGPAEGQLSLEYYTGVERLKEYLLTTFNKRKLNFNELIIETLMETNFIRKHYRQAIKELEKEQKIVIKGKGERGGIKDNTMIIFEKIQKDLFDFENK